MVEKAVIRGRPENLSIGSHTFVGRRVELQALAKISIGESVVINSDSRILTGSHDINSPDWHLETSPIEIGDYCWIATGSMLLPGTILSRGVVVGAGSVVKGQFPENSVIAGNPAKIIKTRKPGGEYRYTPSYNSSAYEAWGHKLVEK
ncbi:hypothetical protein KGA65_16965 [Ideonella sp. B7]|uniref:hypothetical protein n=1 Tax=Ideonella benzenivorans TaxID=2831643 RepID=UPI001CED4531|nr:hypothetical protein [Ideonella benzenivorans]MCA6218227.1 hypothetical protein [Ideonella benzenivorans]